MNSSIFSNKLGYLTDYILQIKHHLFIYQDFQVHTGYLRVDLPMEYQKLTQKLVEIIEKIGMLLRDIFGEPKCINTIQNDPLVSGISWWFDVNLNHFYREINVCNFLERYTPDAFLLRKYDPQRFVLVLGQNCHQLMNEVVYKCSQL